MSARLLGRFDHDSPEWHAARAGGIGGSEIAAVLGLSPWESRFSLWHRKAGTVDPQATNELMRRGHYLEPAVADWFADQHPEYRLRRDVGTYCHSDRPWQVVNPDGLCARAPRGRRPVAIFEAKTDHESWKWGEPGTEEVPIYYRTQVVWAMDVFGADVAHIAVLLGGLHFAEYRIEYNPAEAAELRDAAEEFIASVEVGRAPDIDDHAQTYHVIRQLNPGIDGTDIEIDPDLAEDYIDARIALRDATNDEQRVRSVLAAAMGDAQRAVCNGHVIAQRQSKNGGTPYVVAARNLPDPTLLRKDHAA